MGKHIVAIAVQRAMEFILLQNRGKEKQMGALSGACKRVTIEANLRSMNSTLSRECHIQGRWEIVNMKMNRNLKDPLFSR